MNNYERVDRIYQESMYRTMLMNLLIECPMNIFCIAFSNLLMEALNCVYENKNENNNKFKLDKKKILC